MSLSRQPQSPWEANGQPFDPLRFKKAALLLRSIHHELRHRMLQTIHSHGPLTITELYGRLQLENTVAMQHLAVLYRAGFVNASCQGDHIYYTVNHARVQEVQAIARRLAAVG